MNTEFTDIQAMPLPMQAAHVALYRLRAALSCPPDTPIYRGVTLIVTTFDRTVVRSSTTPLGAVI